MGFMKGRKMADYEKLIAATNPSNIVPVIVINNIDDALPMAKAFSNAGIGVLEITLRTKFGAQAIAQIKNSFPKMSIGAGTVTDQISLEAALSSGCDFVVTPGTTNELFHSLQQIDLPVLPGVSTISEALTAYQKGFKYQKFFPAEAIGGIPALKAINGPLPEICFMPTGGIGAHNARDYLALENVVCVGGTWMMDTASMDTADWSSFETVLKKHITL